MLYTVYQNLLQIAVKIICLPYLISTGVGGSGFIGFDEEMPDYSPVFRGYAQGSQQEASSRKVQILSQALTAPLGVSAGYEREGSATQKSSL